MLGLEQTRVLDRHGDVRRELPEQRLVLRREGTFGVAEEVQGADHFAFAAHRHRQLREHVPKRADVARFLANVVDQDRPPFLDRRSDDSLPEAKTNGRHRVVGISDRVRDPKLLPLVVQQIHRERTETRQTRD